MDTTPIRFLVGRRDGRGSGGSKRGVRVQSVTCNRQYIRQGCPLRPALDWHFYFIFRFVWVSERLLFFAPTLVLVGVGGGVSWRNDAPWRPSFFLSFPLSSPSSGIHTLVTARFCGLLGADMNRMNTRHTRGNAKEGSVQDFWSASITGSKTNGSKRPLCELVQITRKLMPVSTNCLL